MGDGRLGLAGVGLVMSYRYAFTPLWTWLGAVGNSRHLGQVNAVSPSNLSWSGQIGALYFSL